MICASFHDDEIGGLDGWCMGHVCMGRHEGNRLLGRLGIDERVILKGIYIYSPTRYTMRSQ